ncbi:MAG TPA: hypothetical protein VNI02_25870 [Blastocatellia bacterium]|jgi:hypothetical protein|nr:hypothetical protein [Blastocatellia bacterium]
MSDPTSVEGQAADSMLRYRQYLVTKAYNRWLVILTVVLAASAVIQSWAVFTANFAARTQPDTGNQLIVPTASNIISQQSSKIEEMQNRIHHIEERLNKQDVNTFKAQPKKPN